MKLFVSSEASLPCCAIDIPSYASRLSEYIASGEILKDMDWDHLDGHVEALRGGSGQIWPTFERTRAFTVGCAQYVQAKVIRFSIDMAESSGLSIFRGFVGGLRVDFALEMVVVEGAVELRQDGPISPATKRLVRCFFRNFVQAATRISLQEL